MRAEALGLNGLISGTLLREQGPGCWLILGVGFRRYPEWVEHSCGVPRSVSLFREVALLNRDGALIGLGRAWAKCRNNQERGRRVIIPSMEFRLLARASTPWGRDLLGESLRKRVKEVDVTVVDHRIDTADDAPYWDSGTQVSYSHRRINCIGPGPLTMEFFTEEELAVAGPDVDWVG